MPTTWISLQRHRREALLWSHSCSAPGAVQTSLSGTSAQSQSSTVAQTSQNPSIVTTGTVSYISNYAAFPLLNQDDLSLHVSSDWANTVDKTNNLNQTRAQEACLAVVYPIIERSTGNTGYTIGDKQWTDADGAIKPTNLTVTTVSQGISYSAIKAQIDSGSPMILGGQGTTEGHFVLAIGYDDASKAIIVIDPFTGQRVSMSSTTWKEDGGAGSKYTFGQMRTVAY